MDSGAIPLYWSVVFCVTAVKLLLMASYKSTDFEVHRNWLSITHNLNREKWYFENTSQWTLDYPPFFAWFQYGLSHIASFSDSKMLEISSESYSSESTILFQRFSVIVTDFVYAFAVHKCCKTVCRKLEKPKDVFSDDRFILCMLLMTNVGSLMVDHIHFQYNGFLYGFLLISIILVMQNRLLEAAVLFTVLLNFKHIFLYMAPAYFVYLLRNYCFRTKRGGPTDWSSFGIVQFCKLVFVVVTIFSLSFGPFILDGQLYQVLSRLFPFKRGLTHAYWAPNFWALYNGLDKGLTFVGVKTSLIDGSTIVRSSMTGGMVREYRHTLLPSISPLIASAISLVFMMPSLISLWRRPKEPVEFLRCLVLCTFSSFMFGWHVHEKAILMIIIPLSILAMFHAEEARIFLILSTVGHFSLMPLLYKEAESPTKHLMFALFTIYAFFSLALKYRQQRQFPFPLLSIGESVYLLGLIALQLYNGIIHIILGWNTSHPFMPLMLTSLYCGLGVTYTWARLNLIVWHMPLHYAV